MFVCAVVAWRKEVSDPYCASKLGTTSLRMSVFGIIFTVFVLFLVPPWIFRVFDTNCDQYSYSGSCYDYRFYVGPGSCSIGVKSSDGYTATTIPGTATITNKMGCAISTERTSEIRALVVMDTHRPLVTVIGISVSITNTTVPVTDTERTCIE